MKSQTRRHLSKKAFSNIFDIFRSSSAVININEKSRLSALSDQQLASASCYDSAEQLVFPKIDVPESQATTAVSSESSIKAVESVSCLSLQPTITLTRSNSVHLESTDDSLSRARKLTRSNSLQIGGRDESREHSVAARSRARHTWDGSRPRPTTRGSNIQRSTSLRSSRSRSSSATDVQIPPPKVGFTEPGQSTSSRAKKSYKRRTMPEQLLQKAPLQLERFEVADKRKTIRLTYGLEAVPASPDASRFDETHLLLVHKNRQRVRSRRHACIVDKLVWQRPEQRTFKVPSLLISTPVRSQSSTFVNHIPAVRKTRDVTHVPASAKWYAWNLYIDEKGPIIFPQIQVTRKYSTQIEVPESPGIPAIFGWSKGEHNSIQSHVPAKARPTDSRKHEGVSRRPSSGLWSLF